MSDAEVEVDYPSQEILEANKDIVESAMFTNFRMALESRFSKAFRHEDRNGWSRDYPKDSVLDDEFSLSGPVSAALKEFKSKHPYTSTNKEFLDAVQVLYTKLSAHYRIPTPAVRHIGKWDGPSASSYYMPHSITLAGHRSIITALHEYAHARGYGETAAVWWSTNAFKLIWPGDFKNLRAAQNLAYKPRSSIERNEETEPSTPEGSQAG